MSGFLDQVSHAIVDLFDNNEKDEPGASNSEQAKAKPRQVGESLKNYFT